MKELFLDSSQILTGQFPIQDIDKINEYYSKIKSNQKVEPILVTHIGTYSMEKFKEELIKYKNSLKENDFNALLLDEKDLEKEFQSWKNFGKEYILTDGNHRTTAYILNQKEIPAREIENFEDIKLVNKEFKEKNTEGPWVLTRGNSLEEILFRQYYRFCASKNNLRSIKYRVEELIQNNELRIENQKVIYEPNLPF